jgi:alpha-beta hydrolase superfamily lysophospholipase
LFIASAISSDRLITRLNLTAIGNKIDDSHKFNNAAQRDGSFHFQGSGFFLKSWLPGFARVRMRIFPPFLKALWAAALFAGATAFAQSQAPAPAKPSHAPHTLPLTKFYDTPNPLPIGKPGELIRSEPFGEYDLPYEISAVRILYHSRSPSGEDVAVSGVVLVPDGAPPAGGWPVIAWAHDFIGSARQCAPSLRRNLKQGPLLSMYVGVGYAVVASDYAGLGTSSSNAALDMRSNALDVIYSIPAARAALPQLGTKWVAAGYSHGGLAAVGVAETGSEVDDPSYLGAIAISGVAGAQEIFERLAQGPSRRVLVFLAQGIKTVFPEFRVEEMLTDKAIPLYQHISHACEAGLGPELTANEMLKSGWENNRYVKEFFTRNTPGRKPVRGPLLLISGEADPEVPSALAETVVARLCKQKDRVLFVQYPGLDASAVLKESVSEQISWIQARFAGLPAPSNCPCTGGGT